MSYQKFYSCAKYVEAAIKAYDEGNPWNPAGCRGMAALFTYQETDGRYHGKDVVLGNRIVATSAPALIYGVNLALDRGLAVDAITARAMGMHMSVSIKGKREVVIEKVNENTQEETKTTDSKQEETNEPKIDFEYAKSLKVKQFAKKELEDYAAKFNIRLDRRKNLDGMLGDLEVAISLNQGE